jgi:hypothetical protein
MVIGQGMLHILYPFPPRFLHLFSCTSLYSIRLGQYSIQDEHIWFCILLGHPLLPLPLLLNHIRPSAIIYVLVRYVGGWGCACAAGCSNFFSFSTTFLEKYCFRERPHLGLLSIFEIGFKVWGGREFFCFFMFYFLTNFRDFNFQIDPEKRKANKSDAQIKCVQNENPQIFILPLSKVVNSSFS